MNSRAFTPSLRGSPRSGRALATLGLLLALGPGATGGTQEPSSPAVRTPRPVVEKARGEACVADPAFMRRNHMELLKHQRDETVHRGVRDPRSNLQGCIACHAGAESASVATRKTDFCVSCHSYAAVKVDCFECHASKLPSNAFPPLAHPHASAEPVPRAMDGRSRWTAAQPATTDLSKLDLSWLAALATREEAR